MPMSALNVIPGVLSSNASPAMSLLHLHFDILVLVISHLKAADLLSLMQVCRDLHAAIIPHVLRLRVTIRRTNQLLSFCQFILADPPTRSVYLQRFSLDMSFFWSSQVAKMFLEVLRNATHLEELSILDCACLDADPEVAFAVANLTNIKTLTLAQPSKTVRDMLLRMRSPVTRVVMSVPRNSVSARRDAGLLPFADATDLLKRLRNSIITLCITPPKCTKLGVQYLAVTHLELRLRWCALTTHIMHSFPNVRHLTVTIGAPTQAIQVMIKHEDIEAARETNVAQRSVHSWPLLEHVSGDVVGLYHLALNLNVQRLDVVDCDRENSDTERFASVLDDYKCEKLVVKLLMPSSALHETKLRDTAVHIPDSYLCIFFDLEVWNGSSKVEAYLEAALVRKSSVRYLFFRMRACHASCAEKLDYEAMAQKAAQVSPSLCYISIEVEPCPILAWEILQSPPGSLNAQPFLMKCTPEHAMQVMREQGMS